MFIKIYIFILFLLAFFSCNTPTIAYKISSKLKGNYYLKEREFLIKKVDTMKPFVIVETFYVPNASYEGCIFQHKDTFCIKSEITKKHSFESIPIFLNSKALLYMKKKSIDSLNLLDQKLGHQEYNTNLIYFDNEEISTYRFGSNLYYEDWWDDIN